MSNASLTPAAPKPGSRHRHYKGGLYRIEAIATVEATLEPAVLYRSIDPNQASRLWMRPLSAWLEPAAGPLGPVERFHALPAPDPRALRRYLPDGTFPDEWLQAALAHYDEPHRVYHAREHILALFEEAAARDLELSSEQALAVLYHDAVYVPGAPEGANERLSALMLRADLARLDPQPTRGIRLELATRIIEDTVRHEPTVTESALVLDLDLLPLAARPEHFHAYTEMVWLENRHLLQTYAKPRAAFNARRRVFLTTLVARGPLFRVLTDQEAPARANIAALSSCAPSPSAVTASYTVNSRR